MQFLLIYTPNYTSLVFRQGRPKGVACAPLMATTKETLPYAQGGAMTFWA
jgi:hypothetical protein